MDEFVRGAHFFYGHTLLARYADFGYYSPAAGAAFGDDRRAKNRFFAEVGAAARPGRGLYEHLRAAQPDPAGILALVEDDLGK